MSKWKVAVVIPAYNAEKTILACLKAVQGQSYLPSQIIIVDDGSTDDTPEIVQQVDGVTYVRQQNAGPAVARNRGFMESDADIVFFTDSDCIPAQDWIEVSLKGFEVSGVVVVAGSYDIANPESRLARGVQQEIRYRHCRLMPKHPRSFGSFNVAIKSDVFQDVSGFEETYRDASGEDNDLSYKIRKAGGLIYFEPESRVGHHHPTKVFKYLREQFRHGFWRVKMYRDHPHMAGGDDYTFWKDIAEVGVAGMSLLFIGLALFGLSQIPLVIALIGLAVLQLWFTFNFCKSVLDAFFYAGVMFLRSYARMLGFSSGIAAILLLKKA